MEEISKSTAVIFNVINSTHFCIKLYISVFLFPNDNRMLTINKTIRLARVDTVVAGIKGNYGIVLDPIWNEIGQAMQLIASENNGHFATTPLVFPRDDVIETRVEIPY